MRVDIFIFFVISDTVVASIFVQSCKCLKCPCYDCFQLADPTKICMGSSTSGMPALQLNGPELSCGWSGSSDTYHNIPLSSSTQFKVVNCEIFAFGIEK